MINEETNSHGMVIGGFSPFHTGHHMVVQQMKKAGHTSSNVFTTQSGRRPIPVDKKVKYIKTASGEGVNVSSTQTPFHAAAQLHKEGKRGKLVLYGGSDRAAMADQLRQYNGKEGKHGYYKFDSIEFQKVGGERKEGAKGVAGVSGTAARKSKTPTALKKFLPKELHPHAEAIFKDMKESTNPVGIFLLGGPGSGKDYVLKNIFSHFDLTEVQADQILNGIASELIQENNNIVINGISDSSKIEKVKQILEGYTFDFVHVSVTNKVSRLRNEQREHPLVESKRIDKFLKAERLAEETNAFVFNNSINLNESSDFEKVFFADQIEKILGRVVELGLELKEQSEPKVFTEDLRKWFNQKWVRMDTKGNIKGDCAREEGEGKPKCLPLAKARSMDKDDRAKAARRKRRQDPVADRKGKGNSPVFVKTEEVSYLNEKNVPTNPGLWSKAKSLARSKFDVYPSAYANGWASKWYKSKGGGWKSVSESVEAELKTPHTVESIAAKHNVSVAVVIQALSVGKQVEMEHTTDAQTAETIALAHLWENPDYYTKLAKMEQFTGDVQGNLAHFSGTMTARKIGRQREASHFRDVHRRERESHKIAVAKEEVELDEMQLFGTDSYRKHAIAMTPGQGEPVDAFPVKSPNEKPVAVPAKRGKSVVSQYEEDHTECGTPNCCGECSQEEETQVTASGAENIREIDEAGEVDVTPTLTTKKKSTGSKQMTRSYNSRLAGLSVVSNLSLPEENTTGRSILKQMKTIKLQSEEQQLKEAVDYHLQNKISFTENVFRPGSDMFFEMINEAKRLYSEGKYSPKDEYEVDMLQSNIGEIAEYEGQLVVLDYPIEEGLEEACWSGYTQKGLKKKGNRMVPNCVPVSEAEQKDKGPMPTPRQVPAPPGGHPVPPGYKRVKDHIAGWKLVKEEDETGGKGVGKPWREGGGGAVYVRDGGKIRKVRFSQSGMSKKFNDPARVRSFVARHRCLTNKDKTSASYWACRWPRYFSNSGKTWW